MKVAFFRSAWLSPVLPGASKHKDVRTQAHEGRGEEELPTQYAVPKAECDGAVLAWIDLLPGRMPLNV